MEKCHKKREITFCKLPGTSYVTTGRKKMFYEFNMVFPLGIFTRKIKSYVNLRSKNRGNTKIYTELTHKSCIKNKHQ